MQNPAPSPSPTQKLCSMQEIRNLIKTNSDKFKIFFEEAKNSPSAQFNLACCYRNGVGTRKNLSKAAEYLTAAANNGYTNAQYHLGYALLIGEDGIKKNEVLGFQYMELAAYQGHSDAQFIVGKYYYEYKKNLQKGIEFVSKAAKQNHTEAAVFLQGHNLKQMLCQKSPTEKKTLPKTTPPSAPSIKREKSTSRTETFTTTTTTPVVTISKDEIANRQQCKTDIQNAHERIKKLCKDLKVKKIPAVAHQALRASRNLNEEIYSHKDSIEHEEQKLLRKLEALRKKHETIKSTPVSEENNDTSVTDTHLLKEKSDTMVNSTAPSLTPAPSAAPILNQAGKQQRFTNGFVVVKLPKSYSMQAAEQQRKFDEAAILKAQKYISRYCQELNRQPLEVIEAAKAFESTGNLEDYRSKLEKLEQNFKCRANALRKREDEKKKEAKNYLSSFWDKRSSSPKPHQEEDPTNVVAYLNL